MDNAQSVSELFRDHQVTVLKWFTVVMAVLLLPFEVNHLIQGRTSLALALAGVILAFAVTAYSIHRHGRSWLPPVLTFVPALPTLGLAIAQQGMGGVLWAFPVSLLAFYTLPRWQANGISLLVVVMTVALSFAMQPSALTVRIGATLGVTIVFANIFLGMIDRLNVRMGALAHVDTLTGVYNRRYLESCVQRPLQRKRSDGTPMSLLLIDVDHFKKINDSLGHAAGGQALRLIAERLRSSIRAIDLLFRVGGEEFALLLPEAGSQVALRVAEKVRMAVAAEPLTTGGAVTVSIGTAELDEEEDFSELFRRCDTALYQAKADGRNCVRLALPAKH